jgi:hypothetical protein
MTKKKATERDVIPKRYVSLVDVLLSPNDKIELTPKIFANWSNNNPVDFLSLSFL